MNHDPTLNTDDLDSEMTPSRSAQVYWENVIQIILLAYKENDKTTQEITDQLDKTLAELPDGLGEEAKEILRQRRNEFLANILVTAWYLWEICYNTIC